MVREARPLREGRRWWTLQLLYEVEASVSLEGSVSVRPHFKAGSQGFPLDVTSFHSSTIHNSWIFEKRIDFAHCVLILGLAAMLCHGSLRDLSFTSTVAF